MNYLHRPLWTFSSWLVYDFHHLLNDIVFTFGQFVTDGHGGGGGGDDDDDDDDDGDGGVAKHTVDDVILRVKRACQSSA